MNVTFVAAPGVTVLAVFFFLFQSEGLREGHARVRAQLLNAVRWGMVIALAWLLIPVSFSELGSQKDPTILGMVALVGALTLVPVRWFVNIGGREPTWELRRIKLESTQLANRVRRDRGSVPAVRLTDTIALIRQQRTAQTAELCDLMVAELEDLRRGVESWNEAGRRTIRIDEISRELWPGALPPPECDRTEATFRWRLYRAMGELMQAGSTTASPASLNLFRAVLDEIEGFRRLDTEVLIDALEVSAKRWVADSWSEKPWIEGFDFASLGPETTDCVKLLWGRDSVLWGAELDESDRRALALDLVVRAKTDPSEAAPGAARITPKGERK
jgi:hypothetical protein